MRVTTNAYTNNFLKNNNSLLNNMLDVQNRILTKRKYNRASEDSVSAAKAAHVRKSLANLDIYDENCRTAKDLFAAAESVLYNIANETFLDLNAKVVSIQDTKNQTEFNIIAQEIEEYAKHMVQNMNTDFAGRQMFGSTSNDKTPFTTFGSVKVFDADGNEIGEFGGEDRTVVCYNDVPVNMQGEDLLKAVNGGKFEYYDAEGNLVETKTISYPVDPANTGDHDAFPGSHPIYVDIGLGINYAKLDATALDMSLNGAEITGCGIDKDGDSLNLIQLVFDTATALRAGDTATVNKFIDKLDAANTKVLNAITDLGIKQNNMSFYMSKNEVNKINLLEKQNDLEGCDIEEEITNMKTVEAAYNASLSMGSSILPKSLFDFI